MLANAIIIAKISSGSEMIHLCRVRKVIERWRRSLFSGCSLFLFRSRRNAIALSVTSSKLLYPGNSGRDIFLHIYIKLRVY